MILPDEIQDFSHLSDEDVLKLLRNILLTRCLNLKENSQTLALALQLMRINSEKSTEKTDDKYSNLSVDELKTKLKLIVKE